MKEIITGPKKGGQELTASMLPVSGDMVVTTEEIQCVTLVLCQKSGDFENVIGEFATQSAK